MIKLSKIIKNNFENKWREEKTKYYLQFVYINSDCSATTGSRKDEFKF